MNCHSSVTKRQNGRIGDQTHSPNTYMDNYYVSGTLPEPVCTSHIFFKLKIIIYIYLHLF